MRLTRIELLPKNLMHQQADEVCLRHAVPVPHALIERCLPPRELA